MKVRYSRSERTWFVMKFRESLGGASDQILWRVARSDTIEVLSASCWMYQLVLVVWVGEGRVRVCAGANWT
jgi:hypothetical protein